MTSYQTAILLLLATAQAAAPAVLEWLELEIGGSGGPRITPAGYAFVVWGVIVVLALGYALLQAFKVDRALAPLARAIAWPLALVHMGFLLWLFAAVNNWLVATVAIFVAMYFLLRRVYLLIVPWRSSLTWPYRVLLVRRPLYGREPDLHRHSPLGISRRTDWIDGIPRYAIAPRADRGRDTGRARHVGAPTPGGDTDT